jgi:hypothetical protein
MIADLRANGYSQDAAREAAQAGAGKIADYTHAAEGKTWQFNGIRDI